MKSEKKALISVSVIIPVYNVYEWIDFCLESVVTQTFSDFEVLLIDDGSTDGSDQKCQEWAEKDSRIKVMRKKNEGPSIARNYGLQNAAGEYVVFIDADDWVESTYLEKLYHAIIQNHVLMSECDVYRFNNVTGEKVYCVCSGSMGRQYTLEEHMIYGAAQIWKCMIKKTLFTDYGIEFPDCHGEAKAIYSLLLALSGGIANVEEGLYYYRKFRRGSLSEKPRESCGDENAVGLQSSDCLLQGFQEQGMYQKYETLLQRIVKLRLSERLAGLLYRREKEEFCLLAEQYYSYIERKFPNTMNFRYMILGGYNLNRILWHMNILQNPYGRFNFSSLISLMNPVEVPFLCLHKNKYREIMVRRDIKSEFWKIIKEIKPEYIFIDFVEERFDVLEYAGGYITKSDAYDTLEQPFSDNHIIERNSEACFILWKSCFQRFIEKVQIENSKCKIMVIENYLSEEVGDIFQKTYFGNLEEIRKKNQILKRYYNFISEKYPYIPIVETMDCAYYYTDRKYEYGAIPSHLNEIVNRKIANKIEKEIGI